MVEVSILEQEINEQALGLRRLLDRETDKVLELCKQLAGRFHYVVIAARGSSDNAARYAQYLLGARNRLPVSLATPSLFTLYQQPPALNGALVIGISQSGQSPDVVAVLQEARQQGCPTLAITNYSNSALGEACEYLIELHAGVEKAVAATKTYTASLAAIALLSGGLLQDQRTFDALASIPEYIARAIINLDEPLSRVERYRYMDHCTVIGRGFNYATAFEISLKIKELTRVIAEPYSSADFRHGPIAMVRDGFPVILIAPKGEVFQDVRDLVEQLSQLDSELLIISDDPSLLNMANLPFAIPAGLEEYLTPLVAVVPGQLFSLKLAQAKGLDADQPGGLQKVTETY